MEKKIQKIYPTYYSLCAHYAHAKKVCKDFQIKNLEEYHDLYVQSDTLLLADVLESFRNMCIEIYELDPADFLLVPSILSALAWQADLKKTKDIDIGML